MKIFNFLPSLIFLVSLLFTSSVSHSQTIKGDGNVTKETRSISSFSKIEINSVMNVFLKQSNTESIVVETDKNILPYVETYVKDNTLKIEIKNKIELDGYEKLNVYVSLKDINNLGNNSVGNVRSENQLKLTSFTIENNSVGNLDLDLSCDNLNAEINSVGNVTFSGNAGKVNIENNSVGNLDAFDLTADILNIESNSVGNSNVNASGEIYIEANGVGNVTYKGNAVLKKSSESGMGKIRKK